MYRNAKPVFELPYPQICQGILYASPILVEGLIRDCRIHGFAKNKYHFLIDVSALVTDKFRIHRILNLATVESRIYGLVKKKPDAGLKLAGLRSRSASALVALSFTFLMRWWR